MKLLTVIVSILLLSACSPAKKLSRQQKQYDKLIGEYIKDHPERIDTFTVYKKGIDSSDFFRYQADSLKGIKAITRQQIQLQYKDTCTSAQQIFDRGFTLGLSIGSGNVRYRVDTVERQVSPVKLIAQLRKEITEGLIKDKVQEQQIKAANQKVNKYFIWFMLSLAMNALLIIILIKFKIF